MTVLLPFTAIIHWVSSDVVNTTMTTFKHWYDHRQFELVFYTEACANQAACPTFKHFEATAFHYRPENTSLETVSGLDLPERLISTRKV